MDNEPEFEDFTPPEDLTFLIPGVDSNGKLDPAKDEETVMASFGDCLAQTNCFFLYQEEIYYHDHSRGVIVPLTHSMGARLMASAKGKVACHVHGKWTRQAPFKKDIGLPAKLAGKCTLDGPFLVRAFQHPEFLSKIPLILKASTHPVLDPQTRTFLKEGYHEESQTLVLGFPENRSGLENQPWDGQKSIWDNMPCLTRLLEGFPFRALEDRNRFLAFLLNLPLRHVLINHPLPILAIFGNQPDLGKTVLAKLVGILSDNLEPVSLPWKSEGALSKEHQRRLEHTQARVRLLDNLRGKWDCPWLEHQVSNTRCQEFSKRSMNYLERFNDSLWVLTSNGVQITPDLETRILRVNLEFSGSPLMRVPRRDPLAFARRNRSQILREISAFGQLHFENRQLKDAPRPELDARVNHRCRKWGKVVRDVFTFVGERPPSLITEEQLRRPRTAEMVFVRLSHVLYEGDRTLFFTKEEAENGSDWNPLEYRGPFVNRGLLIHEIVNALRDEDLDFFSLEQRATSTNMNVAMGRLLAQFIGKPFVIFRGDQSLVKFILRSHRGAKNVARYHFAVERQASHLTGWKPEFPFRISSGPDGNPCEEQPIPVLSLEGWAKQEEEALRKPTTENPPDEGIASSVPKPQEATAAIWMTDRDKRAIEKRRAADFYHELKEYQLSRQNAKEKFARKNSEGASITQGPLGSPA